MAGTGKAVIFRTKLLLLFTATVIVSVGLVAWTVTAATRRALERMGAQRSDALGAQFRREFAHRAQDITRQVEGIANAEDALRMAVKLAGPNPDYSAYVNAATGLAAAHQLDFLELVADDGTIISSAQSPARFGYKDEAATRVSPEAFLKREDLQDDTQLALEAVRAVEAGNRKLYIMGGRSLDRQFLASLVLTAGMRALLHREPGEGRGGGGRGCGSGVTLAGAGGMLGGVGFDSGPGDALRDGRAVDVWRRMIAARGGDPGAPLPGWVGPPPAVGSLLGEVRSTPTRPYVVVKYAQTLDGRIATSTGDARWISGEPERRVSHALPLAQHSGSIATPG